MKCTRSSIINLELALFTLTLISISVIKCDIPVHCLKSQVKSYFD